MTIQFEALKLRRATEAAYASIKQKILDGELKPGQRLDVSLMAQQLGVSRTPVKEGLQRLASEHLVEVQAHKGTFVSRVDPKDVEETFAVREALELATCRLLAGRLDEQQIATLREINNRLRNPHLTRKEHVMLNHEFHSTLVAYTGNSRLEKIYLTLSANEIIARIHPKDHSWQAPLPNVPEEHEKIINAHADNRVQEAEKIVSEHIQKARRLMLSRMAERADNGQEGAVGL